jgi:hypothetical protein
MNIFKVSDVCFLTKKVFVRLIILFVLGTDTFPALSFKVPGSQCVRRGFHTTLVAEKENAPFFLALLSTFKGVAHCSPGYGRGIKATGSSRCAVYAPKKAGHMFKAFYTFLRKVGADWGHTACVRGFRSISKSNPGMPPCHFPKAGGHFPKAGGHFPSGTARLPVVLVALPLPVAVVAASLPVLCSDRLIMSLRL